jgi:hypothetical protein
MIGKVERLGVHRSASEERFDTDDALKVRLEPSPSS